MMETLSEKIFASRNELLNRLFPYIDGQNTPYQISQYCETMIDHVIEALTHLEEEGLIKYMHQFKYYQ